MTGKEGLLTDYNVGDTGDDIAILMVHNKGAGDEEVHRLAWDAFKAGTDAAPRSKPCQNPSKSSATADRKRPTSGTSSLVLTSDRRRRTRCWTKS